MAITTPTGNQLAPANHNALVELGRALGEADPSVRLVTYEPEQDVVAVYVDAAEDKSAHELAVIDVWLAWLARVHEQLAFKLFNLSEVPSERSRNSMMAAYQGETLFDRR